MTVVQQLQVRLCIAQDRCAAAAGTVAHRAGKHINSWPVIAAHEHVLAWTGRGAGRHGHTGAAAAFASTVSVLGGLAGCFHPQQSNPASALAVDMHARLSAS